jgi:hypothetical protein
MRAGQNRILANAAGAGNIICGSTSPGVTILASIGSGQYDFQTTVTHKLGHALGLGESDDTSSVMNGTLAPATVHRTLSTSDLRIPYDEDGADPQRAAFISGSDTGPSAEEAPTVVFAGGETGRPQTANGGGIDTDFNELSSDSLLVARLVGARETELAAPLAAIAQPLNAPFRKTEPVPAMAGSVASSGRDAVILRNSAPWSFLTGDGQDTRGQRRIAPPADHGELSKAALAAFVQLGRQRDGTLAIRAGGAVEVEDIRVDGEQTGGRVEAELAGAEPILLALLALQCSVADREPENRNTLRWQRG